MSREKEGIIMKKLIAAACAFLCLCFAGATVFAQDELSPNTYTVGDADLSFFFQPEGEWYVLTRDNLENNDFVTDYEQDADDLLNNMEENNIYFDAFDHDITCELIISSMHVGYPRSMQSLHNMDLDDIVDQMLGMDELQDAGVTMHDYQLETVGGQEYLRLEFSRGDADGTFYGRQYTTVINGYITNFTLTAYTGEEVDSAMEAMMTELLTSVQYTGAPEWLFLLIPGVILLAAIFIVVLLLVRSSKKKRERQAAMAAMYGTGVPYAPPMAGQPYPQYPSQPFSQQNGVPTAPPVNHQPYPQYQPFSQQPTAPQAPVQTDENEPVDVRMQESAEQQGEDQQHQGHCCACGAPLKPGSHFCEQCGMRND